MADTAFQPDAFQQDAFQVHVSVDLPTATLTLTGGLELAALTIELPTATLTLTGGAPGLGIAVPAATLTFTGGGAPSVAVQLPTATVTLTAGVPLVAIPLPTATLRITGAIAGASSGTIGSGGTPIVLAGSRLFHGQVTARAVSRDKGYLRIAITVTDLNRQWPRQLVGAVDQDGLTHTLPDGTLSILSGAQTNYGDGPGDGGVFKFLCRTYMPLMSDRETHVHNTNPDYSGGNPVIHWAYTKLGPVLDDFASRQGPYTRYRIDQDQRGWYTTLAPTGTVGDFAVPAPYKLTGDGPETSTTKMANISGRMETGQALTRVFVRGGTPKATKWVSPPTDVLFAGEDYIDAPGAVTAEDADAIGLWHFQQRARPLFSGTAVVPPHVGAVWHVMETLYLTDAELSRDTGFVFDDTPTNILHVSGRLVAGAGGLTILGLNTGPDQLNMNRVEWKSLTFAEGIDGPETAQFVISLWDPDEEFTVVADLAFVTILTDGTAAIEYTLGWGDVQPGDLARQQAPGVYVPGPVVPPQPALRFNVTIVDPLIPVGGTSIVWAQAAEQSGLPKAVAEIPVVGILEQFSELIPPVIGDGYELGEFGVTDIGGRAYTTVTRTSGTAIYFKVRAVAMPILP